MLFLTFYQPENKKCRPTPSTDKNVFVMCFFFKFPLSKIHKATMVRLKLGKDGVYGYKKTNVFDRM